MHGHPPKPPFSGLVYESITYPAVCQPTIGSISNTVEIATGWYKPQEHFPPVNIDIPQAIRYAL
jgi:hypothetical protein